MKLIALDTSTEWCSVALWLDGELTAEVVRAGQTHSQVLLPMLDRLLAGAGLGLHDLDGIAYGRGPGSFTGLRIACGVVQGLAMGAGLPVVGVTTLEAMAEEADAEEVVTLLDARVGEVYAAVWRRDEGSWTAREGPGLYAPEAAPIPAGEGATGCGSGFTAYADVLSQRYAGRLAAVRPEVFPHARSIARLAVPRLERGEGVAAEAAEPWYLRDKVALKRSERS